MELTTIKELYRNTESYLDKEVTVGRLGAQHPRLQDIRIYRGK